MRIYLAGKITSNGWRNEIVRGQEASGGCTGELYEADWREAGWPVLERAIFGEHDYVGPYLIGCDHGCFHGPNSHGVGLGDSNTSVIGRAPYSQAEIVRFCRGAISKADLVFVWIEETDCHGTLAEIGYAAALAACQPTPKPLIAIAMPFTSDAAKELWFAAELAHTRLYVGGTFSPAGALRAILAEVTPRLAVASKR